MGEVDLAQDTSELGRSVALKILPADDAKDKTRLQRFALEARTVSNLNHPWPCRGRNFGISESGRFIQPRPYVPWQFGILLRRNR